MAKIDVDEMLDRFRERAAAVKERGIPPLEGEARRRYIEAAQQDFVDFALIGSASWSVEGDHLVLRIPLRPQEQAGGGAEKI